MLSHEQIWAAIDRLAARHEMSASGLAKRAGLDPTTFNRSKRFAGDGRPRWPSTESIAKVLEATGEGVGAFLGLVGGPRTDPAWQFAPVPLLGFAQAGAGGFFDDGGFPVGQGWDEVPFPGQVGDGVYALQVSGDSMMPVYREGDIILVAPTAQTRPGDRVVVRTRDGEVMAKVLARRTTKTVELASLNPAHPSRLVALVDLEWIARIVWASQ
ncbi:S24 family peptidase [Prosthecomicrobium pneumaticum]|uniref:Phage repressor protein C with HTH and peptisase S24 domain n=1 Tax=Prosthecomicrobium pneumaticum TaxID=81895 RepID=A0A7W9FMM3_9HYPH|nr:helix-turn-helix transcriptional regulator [Prosthecomicrobium pneumaticum]MBB5753371.1 phage repressor protein C with HTH and peptisase S24 domain [Prosthecomicrobium pneumaticum]